MQGVLRPRKSVVCGKERAYGKSPELSENREAAVKYYERLLLLAFGSSCQLG
jgi:hypothetical protein